MSLPVLLSPEALSFWTARDASTREPFRASVLASLRRRATEEGESIPIYADPEGEPLEIVHPCAELEPCPACNVEPAPARNHRGIHAILERDAPPPYPDHQRQP